MHKKFILLQALLILSISGVLFAQEESEEVKVNWFTNTKTWNLSITEEAINYYNFTQYKLGLGVSTLLDMKELKAQAGFFVGNQKINGTSQVTYAPTIYQKYNIGLKMINHLCFNIDYYSEYDFLIGPYFEYRPNSHFSMDNTILFMQKCSYIDNLPKGNKLVYSSCPAFYYNIYYYPLDWLTVNFSLSSYSFYRYYLFLSPDAKLAFNFKANDHLNLEVAGEIQAVDFFTMSANFNCLGFSIGANWRF